VRLVTPKAVQTAESATPVSVSHDEEMPLAPQVQDDEEFVDYGSSPERSNMDINMECLSSDYLCGLIVC
jgi:hypothetical protein